MECTRALPDAGLELIRVVRPVEDQKGTHGLQFAMPLNPLLRKADARSGIGTNDGSVDADLDGERHRAAALDGNSLDSALVWRAPALEDVASSTVAKSLGIGVDIVRSGCHHRPRDVVGAANRHYLRAGDGHAHYVEAVPPTQLHLVEDLGGVEADARPAEEHSETVLA